jgi:hypothetical protein
MYGNNIGGDIYIHVRINENQSALSIDGKTYSFIKFTTITYLQLQGKVPLSENGTLP